jgi:hypothetical protein
MLKVEILYLLANDAGLLGPSFAIRAPWPRATFVGYRAGLPKCRQHNVT